MQDETPVSEFEGRYGGQTGQSGFAVVSIRFEAVAELHGVDVVSDIPADVLPERLTAACARGIRRVAEGAGLSGLRATIVTAFVSPVDATATAFERAAAAATRRFVEGL